MAQRREEQREPNYGTVISVRSSVVDVYFSQHLPTLYDVLRGGEKEDVVIEVLSHLDSKTIRGIALTPTQGLAEGSRLIDTEHPPMVPVGERLRGRIFNVFGEAMGTELCRREDTEKLYKQMTSESLS
jgi:F-type H+-transporting ATPase subunit beta